MSETNYSEAPAHCCSDLSVSGERLFQCEEFAVRICVCVCVSGEEFAVQICVCVFQVKSLLFRSVYVCVSGEEFAVQICVCVCFR